MSCDVNEPPQPWHPHQRSILRTANEFNDSFNVIHVIVNIVASYPTDAGLQLLMFAAGYFDIF